MNAIQTWKAAEAAGITLRETASGRIAAAPRYALTDEIAESIRQHRAAILDYLRTGHLGALIPPETKGMPFEKWHTQEIMKQAAEYRHQLKQQEA